MPKRSKLSVANASASAEVIEEPIAIQDAESPDFVIANPYLPERVKPENYVSTGVTPLNLAITNHSLCGIEKGTYVLMVGSSSSGKSMLALTILAEAANNPSFDNYSLLYADCEGGAGFPLRPLFGNKLADRIEFTKMKNGEPFQAVEDFYASVDSHLRDKSKPFIYILDSMDCLSSTQELQKFDANITEREKNLAADDISKQYIHVSTGFTDGKAKANSSNLRRIRNKLPVNGSILIIICQERQALGAVTYTTRSGGNALTYYADYEIWLELKGKLEKTFDGNKRQIGQVTRARIKKNRITGIKTEVRFPLYNGVGIADADAILDWLIEEKAVNVPTGGTSITLPGQKPMSRAKCIELFEENPELARKMAEEHWQKILRQITVVRKMKYA
jgi:RecA/RadA recombinase